MGLAPALRLIGDVTGPLAAARIDARKRAKDFNDQETDDIEGTSSGMKVTTKTRGARFSSGPSGTLDRDDPIW